MYFMLPHCLRIWNIVLYYTTPITCLSFFPRFVHLVTPIILTPINVLPLPHPRIVHPETVLRDSRSEAGSRLYERV